MHPPSERHETLTSIAYDKYADMRMPWVGRVGGFNRTFAITDSSQKVAPLDENRCWILLTNDGSNTIYLNFGEDAVANSVSRLNANGGSLLLDRNTPWANTIFAICATGLTSTLLVNDVSQVTMDGRGE